MTPHDAAHTLKAWAKELGFDLAGVTRPEPSARAEAYRAWIAAGKQGEMAYLGRAMEERFELTRKFPWARSVLAVAMAYFQPPPENAGESAGQTGKIARYTWGRDYHKVLEYKLRKLEQRIRSQFHTPGADLHIRTYVDTGPILERELAARAGLGWIGKHTLLIHPRHGSYFLLGELITSLELEPDSPIGQHCGTCTRCIDACPTRAIEPWSVDARKCISYLTLEHRGAIDESLHAGMQKAGYVVGCDICQEVCPFNRDPLQTREADFAARPPAPAVGLQEVLAWQEQEWDILTRGRASRRAKFAMWQRNAAILEGQPAQARDS